MPKRVKKPRRDENQAAFDIVQRIGGERDEPSADEISRVMQALGQRGGRIGGKRRLETMTPEQRSAVALKAARARWSKRRKKA
jgi:hypothetical protein